jgi:hypothetical protein
LPIGPDIRAAPAASFADETRLDIGQPYIIGPSVAADRCVVAATEIRAVNQQAADTGGAHFSEGDFLAGKIGDAPLKPGPSWQATAPLGPPLYSETICADAATEAESHRRGAGTVLVLGDDLGDDPLSRHDDGHLAKSRVVADVTGRFPSP